MDKIMQQLELEKEMSGSGIERYRAHLKTATEKDVLHATKPGQKLLRRVIQPVIEGVKAEIEAAESGKPGRKRGAVKYLRMLEPEVSAFLALRVVISHAHKTESLTKVAARIAQHIEDEVRCTAFKKDFPRLFDRIHEELISSERGYNHVRRGMTSRYNKLLGYKGLPPWDAWSNRDKVHLGCKMLDLLMPTGMVTVETTYNTQKRVRESLVQATDEMVEWMESQHDLFEVMFPMYMPMVVPPKPWVAPWEGGYFHTCFRPLPLIKTYNPQYNNDLVGVDMPQVYSALNRIQSVGWRVNTKVLDTVIKLIDAREKDVLPCIDPLPIPKKPRDIATNDEARKKYREAARLVYNKNRKMRGKRIALLNLVKITKRFRDEQDIYFPHQLDFRGRCYPVPAFLQPQGDDTARGLLTFSNPKPLGNEGISWLAIHGANCFGVDGLDKKPLAERVEWAKEHTPEIQAVAADPMAFGWWKEAEAPFQFLAFCFEWTTVLEADDPEAYESGLPVSLDGSCNGLQNFGALLRDVQTGQAVNLIPNDQPEDVYQQVADEVSRRVDDELIDGDTMPERQYSWRTLWSGRVTRKVVKRPTMTFPYGAKQYGFQDQIISDVVNKDPDYDFGEEKSAATLYMANQIWATLGDIVPAARKTMDWLQGVARVLAAEDQPVGWTTPIGLPVIQEYQETRSRLIKTWISGKIMRPSLIEAFTKLDRRRPS
jgi:DNA-directed RNA polymerase